MENIFSLFKKNVVSLSGSAIEKILKKIIYRFLEQPIQDNTFTLSISDDYSFKFTLNKSFLDKNVLNNLTGFITFGSVYASQLNIEVKYNLSVFNINLDRFISEIVIHDPEVVERDDDLDKSINEFKDCLPVETRSLSYKEWILNKITNFSFNINFFTLIIRLNNILNQLSFSWNKFRLSYIRKDSEINANLSLEGISLISGTKKNQKKMIQINEINLKYSNFCINISVKYVEFVTTSDIHEYVNEVLNRLGQIYVQKQPNQSDQQSEDNIFDIKMCIDTLIVKYEDFEFVVNNIIFEKVKGETFLKINDVTARHGDDTVLNLSPIEMEGVFATSEKERVSFEDFPSDVHEAIRYNFDAYSNRSDSYCLRLKDFTLKITRDLINIIKKIVDQISLINVSKSTNTDVCPNKKISSRVKVNIDNIDISIEKVGIKLHDTRINVLHSIDGLAFRLSMLIQLKNMIFSVEGYNLYENPNTNRDYILATALSSYVLNDDKFFSVSSDFRGGLFRISGDIQKYRYILDIMKPLVDDGSNKDNSSYDNKKSPINLSLNVNISNLYFEYITLRMPARLLLLVPDFTVSLFGMNTSYKGVLMAKLRVFISATRNPIPVNFFDGDFNPLSHSYTEILTVETSDVLITVNESVEITLNNVSVNGGFCFDSIQLLTSFLTHVQYNLDVPESLVSGKVVEKNNEFISELETRLTQTVSKSLCVENLKPNKCKCIQDVPTIDDIMRLMESQHEELIEVQANSTFSCSHKVIDPVSQPTVSACIVNLNVNISLFLGNDLDELLDLREILTPPPTNTKSGRFNFRSVNSDSSRLTEESLNLEVKGSLETNIYPNDKNIKLRTLCSIKKFDIVDMVQKSVAKNLVSIDAATYSPSDFCIKIDLLNSQQDKTELGISITLPDLVLFITQQQIDFLLEFSSRVLPEFPSSKIVDEPPIFRSFEITTGSIKVFAHFKFWLDVHIDDVVFRPPKCNLTLCKGVDGLIGSLVEFYMCEMSRPGVTAIIKGLPVIKNIRRVSSAIKDIFILDSYKHGGLVGIGKSFGTLFQTIAVETLNAGANASIFGETLLGTALNALDAESKTFARQGIATLILEKGIQAPKLLLVPGIMSFKKVSEMLKDMRNKVDPNYTKKIIYRKVQ